MPSRLFQSALSVHRIAIDQRRGWSSTVPGVRPWPAFAGRSPRGRHGSRPCAGRPAGEGLHDVEQGAAGVGEGVFDAGRHGGVDGTGDDAVAFQSAAMAAAAVRQHRQFRRPRGSWSGQHGGVHHSGGPGLRLRRQGRCRRARRWWWGLRRHHRIRRYRWRRVAPPAVLPPPAPCVNHPQVPSAPAPVISAGSSPTWPYFKSRTRRVAGVR